MTFLQRLRARLTQDKFDPSGGAEFYELLRTTFEPGALLIAAATARNRTVTPPMARAYESTNRKAALDELEALRNRVRNALAEPEGPDPALLIEYVETLEFKSPRVVYNLACVYSIAANTDSERREAYLDRASEYLRQSIARTPPRERLALLRHARVDPDMDALVRARESAVDELQELIPKEAEPPSDTPPSSAA